MRVKKFSSLKIGDKVELTATDRTYVTTLNQMNLNGQPTSSISHYRNVGFMTEGVISRIDAEHGRVYVDTPDGTMVIIWMDFAFKLIGLIRQIVVLIQETFSK